ncbi:MAG TPA: hypothetical protein VF171_09910 [Trueperaceae bacterium]
MRREGQDQMVPWEHVPATSFVAPGQRTHCYLVLTKGEVLAGSAATV